MKLSLLVTLLFIPLDFDIGFSLPYFILGMAGGFVRSIAKDGVGLRHALVNIIVGAIISTYFTPLLAHRFGFVERDQIFATALAVGGLAMSAFLIWDRVEAWLKQNPKFVFTIIINWLSNLLSNAAKNLNAGDTKETDDRPRDRDVNGGDPVGG